MKNNILAIYLPLLGKDSTHLLTFFQQIPSLGHEYDFVRGELFDELLGQMKLFDRFIVGLTQLEATVQSALRSGSLLGSRNFRRQLKQADGLAGRQAGRLASWQVNLPTESGDGGGSRS